eukprot:8512289-Pyramimonas_sp.AAC.3
MAVAVTSPAPPCAGATCVSMAASAVAPTWETYAVLRFIQGISGNGMYLTAFTLLMEWVPSGWHTSTGTSELMLGWGACRDGRVRVALRRGGDLARRDGLHPARPQLAGNVIGAQGVQNAGYDSQVTCS